MNRQEEIILGCSHAAGMAPNVRMGKREVACCTPCVAAKISAGESPTERPDTLSM